MVDFTNTLRARGMSRREAILAAGPTRMKPILMTTTATVCGMLPTALAFAEGSEWRQPMAIAVIGGLVLSTLLTLLIVPSMYTIIDDVAWFFMKAWYRLYLKQEPDPEMRWKRKI
jgi:HAE1 family hydrophobic/amphiphilic exporter-1